MKQKIKKFYLIRIIQFLKSDGSDNNVNNIFIVISLYQIICSIFVIDVAKNAGAGVFF